MSDSCSKLGIEVKCRNNIILINEHIVEHGIKLSRVVAVKKFKNILKGEKGGYVQSQRNISGNGWVADNAKVYGKAIVKDSAVVSGDAIVKDNAVVGNYAIVTDKVVISGNAKILNWAKISGKALVCGQVSGTASVGGMAIVKGLVSGNALITCVREVASTEVISGMTV